MLMHHHILNGNLAQEKGVLGDDVKGTRFKKGLPILASHFWKDGPGDDGQGRLGLQSNLEIGPGIRIGMDPAAFEISGRGGLLGR